MKKVIIILCSLFFVVSVQAQTSNKAADAAVKTEIKKKKKKKKRGWWIFGKKNKFTPQSPDPMITLESAELDYGTIKKDSDPFRVMKITNVGAKPLVINSCSGSCGCTVPTCPKEEVAPGETAEIKVRYDTKRMGNFAKTVTINSNDPKNARKSFRIKGKVID